MYAPLLRPAAAGGRSFMSLVLLAASLGLANVVKSFWGGLGGLATLGPQPPIRTTNRELTNEDNAK